MLCFKDFCVKSKFNDLWDWAATDEKPCTGWGVFKANLRSDAVTSLPVTADGLSKTTSLANLLHSIVVDDKLKSSKGDYFLDLLLYSYLFWV